MLLHKYVFEFNELDLPNFQKSKMIAMNVSVPQLRGREAASDVLPPEVLRTQAGQEVGVPPGEKQLH